MLALAAIAGALLLIGMLLLAYILRRRRRLPPAVRARLWAQWERVRAIADDHRRIIEAETVLFQALDALRYPGSFAEKLKEAGPRFSHTQAIWDAHKLRNRIAHEAVLTLALHDADRACATFERALRELS